MIVGLFEWLKKDIWAMNDVIDNRTKLMFFDCFNMRYSDQILALCPLLSKFKIAAITVEEYLHIAESFSTMISDIEKQMYSCLVDKKEYDASSTRAIIIANIDLYTKFNLSVDEHISAIAHEVGHIIHFFKDDKDSDIVAEELYADGIASKLGLASPLYSVLDKLSQSDLYEKSINEQLKLRMRSIRILYL